MMKRLIYTLAVLLGSLGVQAQTAQPNLPSGAERYSQTLWISPDSTLWTGKGGNYTNIGSWFKTDSLNKTRQKAFALDVTDFGAVGDSSTINTQAFYDAFDYAVANGFSNIYIPEGVYLIDSVVVLPKDLSMFGEGYGSCLIPVGDSINYISDIQGSAVFLYNAGIDNLIGGISNTIAKGQNYIKDSGASSVFMTGDVLKLVDTADFSFSGYRAEYKLGEYFTVVSKSNDTLFLDHPVSDDYTNILSTVIYKSDLSRSGLSDLRIGTSSASPGVQRVIFEDVGFTEFYNLDITGSRHYNIRISGAYNVKIDRIYSRQTFPTPVGIAETQYALQLSGAQNFIVSNSELYAYRHAFTGANIIWRNDVILRHGTIYNTRMFSKVQHGADLHGASSDVTFDNDIMTGCLVRGRSHKVINSTIYTPPSLLPEMALKSSEIKQIDFTITNNKIYSRDVFMEVQPVNVSVSNGSGQYQPDTGGVFKFSENILIRIGQDSSTASNVAFNMTYQRPLIKDLGVTFDISDNDIICRNRVPQVFRIFGNSGYKAGAAYLKNNNMSGVLLSIDYLNKVYVAGNSMEDNPWNAVTAQNTDIVVISGNTANNICVENPTSNSNKCFALIRQCGFLVTNGNLVLNTGYATNSIRHETVTSVVSGENYFNNLQPFYSGVSDIKFPSSSQLKVESLNIAPTSATDTGTVGDVRISSGYIYVCTATNTWVRAALTTW